MIQPSAILKFLADRRETIGFWIAATTLRLVVAIVANAAPYYETRRAFGFDGYEVVGFPFVFRNAGVASCKYDQQRRDHCGEKSPAIEWLDISPPSRNPRQRKGLFQHYRRAWEGQ